MKSSLKLALMLLSLLAGSLPVCGPLHSQDAAKPQKEAAEPVFKAEKYKEAFDKGKEEFAAGDYKGAGKSFKKALSGGKEKADKAIVNKWVLGCRGAPTLKKLQLMQKRNLWNEAYDQLVNIALPRYRETPLKNQLYKLYADLDGALFHRLENFNFVNKSLFSQKYGKSFVNDPLYFCPVGTQCLRWENTTDGKPGMLKLPVVPKDWSQFNSVEFWMALHVPATPEVFLMSSGAVRKKAGVARAVVPAGQALRTCLMSRVPLKKTRAWQLVRISMASFKSQGGGSLESVTDFRLQVPGGKPFNFLIDEIRLRRKNPKQAAGGARKR